MGLTKLVKTIFPTSLLMPSASAEEVESIGTVKSKTASNHRGRRCMLQTLGDCIFVCVEKPSCRSN